MMKAILPVRRALLRWGIALLVLGSIGAALVGTTPSAQAASLPHTLSSARAASLDLSHLFGTDPRVHQDRLTLPAASCTALRQAQPGASCQILHYWAVANHQPLPQGKQAAANTGWYWWAWDEIDGIGGIWSFTLSEDGWATGSNVWMWNEGCTAGGLQSTVTWCGDLYNGGGSPNYAMQFGLNGVVCAPTPWGCINANHGMRRWIDDNGNPAGFNYW